MILQQCQLFGEECKCRWGLDGIWQLRGLRHGEFFCVERLRFKSVLSQGPLLSAGTAFFLYMSRSARFKSERTSVRTLTSSHLETH